MENSNYKGEIFFEVIERIRHNLLSILGQVESDDVLTNCALSFGFCASDLTESADALQREIECGARIARAFAYVSTRTYEGRPLVTGALVSRRADMQELMEEDQWKGDLILKFAPPVQVDWTELASVVPLLQLADGKSSVLWVDSKGLVHGLLSTERFGHLRHLSFHCGYILRTTKNREVSLLYAPKFTVREVAIFDGFTWTDGNPRPLQEIRCWYYDHLTRRGLCGWAYSDESRIELDPMISEVGRIHSLVDMVDQLSTIRLSSIIALCPVEETSALLASGALRSLRPELNTAVWDPYDDGAPMELPDDFGDAGLRDLPAGLLNIFRLDGIHILTVPELRVAAAAQLLQASQSRASQSLGAGRSAAIELSRLLGHDGLVIKVSSDGPVTLYSNGMVYRNDTID